MVRGVVNASLENTTSMPVSGNFYTISRDCIIDKLNIISSWPQMILFYKYRYLIILWGKFVEAFLYNVIAIEILDQNDHMQT